jgi:diguanylate cyclase (GGDEF)-like protein
MTNAGRQRQESRTSRAKHTISVRARLMILAVIALAPLVAERIYNEEFDRSERIEAAHKRVLEVARQGVTQQNQVIVSTRALLNAISNARAEFKFSDAECNEYLTKTVASASGVKVLSVANVSGKIICSSYPSALGLDISGRTHFEKAIDTAGFVLGDYLAGTRVTGPLITLALAQRGVNGAAAAVVLGVLDLSWFESAAKAFVSPSGYMLMIDGNGTVLAQFPNDQSLIGKTFKEAPLIQAMLARREGLITTSFLDGERRIFGYEQLPGTQAHIAFGIDENEVIAHANHEMLTAFTEVSAVAALVLLGIWFGGERLLVRPIRTLAETASRIGHGDVKIHAADLPWAAEFVPLAVALDDMAGKLSEREQELRDTNMQLRELAQVDALTGLANRRAFNERLFTEWKLACRLRRPIAVLMIDVDYFKRFNDHYGHVQGDACLRKVAGIVMSATRAQGNTPSVQRIGNSERHMDFGARYGGEEFAVLLQGADLDKALHIGERLRHGVEQLLMAHTGAPWGFVSVSVGAASILPAGEDSPQDLIEAADSALYEAKRQGRNQVAGQVPVALPKALSQAG